MIGNVYADLNRHVRHLFLGTACPVSPAAILSTLTISSDGVTFPRVGPPRHSCRISCAGSRHNGCYYLANRGRGRTRTANRQLCSLQDKILAQIQPTGQLTIPKLDTPPTSHITSHGSMTKEIPGAMPRVSVSTRRWSGRRR